jgi:hypothetical protein
LAKKLFPNRKILLSAHIAVGEAFPTGPVFLLAKSTFPSPKTPTVLSQQKLGNPVGKAFANRVGVFANSLVLLAKHVFPVVHAHADAGAVKFDLLFGSYSRS